MASEITRIGEGKAMYIYISGPYSAPDNIADSSARQDKILANVARAQMVAIELAKAGHSPFLPHTMMQGWEAQQGFDQYRIMNLCLSWVSRCDALFLIQGSEGDQPSKGASIERAYAENLGLPIYTDLGLVPRV